jgi:Flp pilus assembly protein TadD
MKTIPLLLVTAALALSACDDKFTQQWLNPDKEPAAALEELDAPDVLGVNDTLEKQAKEALEKGDIRRAGQFYEQLVGSKKGTDADKLRYKLGLADCMRRAGENDDALAAFEEILKDNPDNIEAMEGHGLTQMALGKSTDAGQQFADIMKKDPKRWRTLNALGILFVTKNMIPEAMAYYTEALKYSPDNTAVLNNVGLSQAADHNYPRAIEALEQASRVSGGGERRRQVELNLAMVYGVSGDLDTAREIAEKYLQGPALDNNLGLYAHLAKDDSLAKTYLNMALSGSQTFYERAWTNLDMLNSQDTQSPDSPASVKRKIAPKAASTETKPEEKAATKKSSSTTKKK